MLGDTEEEEEGRRCRVTPLTPQQTATQGRERRRPPTPGEGTMGRQLALELELDMGMAEARVREDILTTLITPALARPGPVVRARLLQLGGEQLEAEQ